MPVKNPTGHGKPAKVSSPRPLLRPMRNPHSSLDLNAMREACQPVAGDNW